MTSLGYGEIYPTTYPGYGVGGVASISGLITLALPMVIIGQNFSENFRLVQQEAEDAADAAEAAQARSVAKAKQMMRKTAAFKRAKSRFGASSSLNTTSGEEGGCTEGPSSAPVRLGMRGRILSADHQYDEPLPMIARSKAPSTEASSVPQEGARATATGAGAGVEPGGSSSSNTVGDSGIIMSPSGVKIAAEGDKDVGTP